MIGVGLIGYGYWGPNLARNIAEAEGLCLRAIADARPERQALAAARHPGSTIFADAMALIRSDGIQAVVIATPLKTHHALAKAALDAGKHVLVEKPLAASSAEACELADLAERNGVRLMVDHTFVYTGAVRKIHALVDAGELGDLLYLDSVRVNLGLFRQDSNVVWDLAAHDLAVMDHLVRAGPVAVSANGTALAGYEHENIAYITVHFDNGFLGHLHVNWLAPVKVRMMLIGGSRRMLVYDDMEPSEKVRVYDKGVDLEVQDDRVREQILVSYRTGDMYAPKLDRREALASVLREFADAIEAGRPPLTGAAAGIRVVRLLEAAEQSLRREGQRVRL